MMGEITPNNTLQATLKADVDGRLLNVRFAGHRLGFDVLGERRLRVDSGPLLSLWDLLKPLAPMMTTMGGQNGSSMQHARHKKARRCRAFSFLPFCPHRKQRKTGAQVTLEC